MNITMTRNRWIGVGAGIAAIVIAVVLVIVLTGGDKTSEEAVVEETTTTTTTTLPTWPLTGLPDATAPVAGKHPAVVVKMDNSADARPQTGINEADVVYELLVEGITRFALVFHSNLADPVGPVRSARSSDPNLVADLSKPLFAWSGGNPGVTAEIRVADEAGILTDASYNLASPAYYRSNDRIAPHNLYVHLPQLLEMMTPQGQGAPAPIFEYRKVGDPVASTTTSTIAASGVTSTTQLAPGTPVPAPGFTIDFEGAKVDYAWDAAIKGWRRYQVDGTHNRADSATVDPAGKQVAPANVVIMFLDYGQSPSDSRSPMAISIGSGPAWVFSDGKVVPGTWNRAKPADPAQLLDAAGKPILLSPGRTWVELPRKGQRVDFFGQPGADSLLAVKKG